MNYSLDSNFRLIDCNEAEHAAAILEILNDAIVNSTALYDYIPRSLDSMKTWFSVKRENGFPVIGVVDELGKLLGFASWGTFRAFPAYKYTVEHSIYIHHEHRGRGLSKVLMQALIQRAQQAQLHVLIGCIDATNQASIGLHEKMGFTQAGTFKQVGFKFGQWLDAAFYQLILNTPFEPLDG
ncbi:N-acetyltransferase family protein [Acinetobacter baumannii]|uniref:GNAT family N-acetyltransferase n=1 Tax=Acinetobacter baumannii TaxID=470 RepID=UPI000810AA12|nr:GNAT family N-acetyltransferase [Acinetobacter baumannii]MDC4690882.1 GNAT family N-acetyltransferase [Acinetobacter baumannii]MDV7540950.1 N-acetyltransferase family protein [Acinetobacter baumannii]